MLPSPPLSRMPAELARLYALGQADGRNWAIRPVPWTGLQTSSPVQSGNAYAVGQVPNGVIQYSASAGAIIVSMTYNWSVDSYGNITGTLQGQLLDTTTTPHTIVNWTGIPLGGSMTNGGGFTINASGLCLGSSTPPGVAISLSFASTAVNLANYATTCTLTLTGSYAASYTGATVSGSYVGQTTGLSTLTLGAIGGHELAWITSAEGLWFYTPSSSGVTRLLAPADLGPAEYLGSWTWMDPTDFSNAPALTADQLALSAPYNYQQFSTAVAVNDWTNPNAILSSPVASPVNRATATLAASITYSSGSWRFSYTLTDAGRLTGEYWYVSITIGGTVVFTAGVAADGTVRTSTFSGFPTTSGTSLRAWFNAYLQSQNLYVNQVSDHTI